MSSHDLYEDGFPHGTRDGYDRGCRGNACPAGIEHGLSCKRAFSLSAGDYRYARLVGEGRTPAEIAAKLQESPHTHPAPVKTRAVVDELDDDNKNDTVLEDEPDQTEQEEPIMPTPKTIVKKARKRRSPAGPPQSVVRAWAHDNGIDVNARGAVRSDVMAAYAKAHEEPVAESTPVVTVDVDELAALNREADGEPDYDVEALTADDDEAVAAVIAEPQWPGDKTAMETVATYQPDLVEQLAQLNAHLEHLRDERDQAHATLALVLAKWAEEQENARRATLDLAAAQGAARILQAALAQAEEELVAARGLAAARAGELERLQAAPGRTWWKRGAA